MRAPHDDTWVSKLDAVLSFCHSEMLLLWDLNTWWCAHLRPQQVTAIGVLLLIYSSAAMDLF